MPNDQISIDELLARQSQPGRLLVTIEALPGDDARVKVTPYVADVGCPCSRALNVSKDAIESVTTTDEVHICCSKRLLVVEVVFAEATLADIFQVVPAPNLLEDQVDGARRQPSMRCPARNTARREEDRQG